MDIFQFWHDVLDQDAEAIRMYFHQDAYVNWHCTNEHFTVEEFIRANCEYPGDWDGEVERVEAAENLLVTAVCVHPRDKSAFFHVVSFIRLVNDKIASMDEYWADDGPVPSWRQEMRIGRPIK